MISQYQSMPITKESFVGVPTDESPKTERVLRVMNGDGIATVTFTFDDSSEVSIVAPLGVSDWVIAGNVTGITTTLSVIMS